MAWQRVRKLMIDPEYRKELGRRIRALRKKRKLTQKELAGEFGISYNQLNKYECGLTCPSAELFIKLADRLSVTLDYLLTGRDLEVPLKNPRLLDRLKELESFDQEDQEAVLKLIDAMIFKRKVQGAVEEDKRLRSAQVGLG